MRTKNKTLKAPKLGSKIYVDSSFSMSHGSDDVVGGLATVTKLDTKYGTTFVSVKEHPGHAYNWEILSERQKELKKEFGRKKAYPDPDIDTPWIEEGDYVTTTDRDGNTTSGIHKGPPIW